MKTDRLLKVLLGIIAVLLFLNLFNHFVPLKPALATSENEQKGRYEIAAWGGISQNADPRSGCYVVDTATGLVVASKTEVHRLAAGEGK